MESKAPEPKARGVSRGPRKKRASVFSGKQRPALGGAPPGWQGLAPRLGAGAAKRPAPLRLCVFQALFGSRRCVFSLVQIFPPDAVRANSHDGTLAAGAKTDGGAHGDPVPRRLLSGFSKSFFASLSDSCVPRGPSLYPAGCPPPRQRARRFGLVMARLPFGLEFLSGRAL
jgi:hypothetical protein